MASELSPELRAANLVNTRVWEAIDKDLGEVTDVSLVHFEGYSTIFYKSNGEDKRISIGGDNIRPMLISFLYYIEWINYNSKSYSFLY